MMSLFEWDPEKDRENFLKHGIYFDEALSVWGDPLARDFFDPDHSTEEEERWIRFGLSEENNTLFVVFCERDGDVIRIISARKATPAERKSYEG